MKSNPDWLSQRKLVYLGGFGIVAQLVAAVLQVQRREGQVEEAVGVVFGQVFQHGGRVVERRLADALQAQVDAEALADVV